MAYFASALRRWLEQGHTQTELETAAGLRQGRIWKYLRGEMPRGEALAAILKVMDEETRYDLLQSYLMDACPEEFRHELSLVVGPGRASVGEAPGRYAGKDKFSKALAWLVEQGRHNPDVVTHIVSLHDMMTGKSSGSGD